MTMRAKDPGKRSRLLRAAAISALFSGFFGALVVLAWCVEGCSGGWKQAEEVVLLAAAATMFLFWMLFIPLYVFTVHKSRKTVEFEHQARLDERKRAEHTRQALARGEREGNSRGDRI